MVYEMASEITWSCVIIAGHRKKNLCLVASIVRTRINY